MGVFLDHNSTTNLLPIAKEAMLASMSDTLNASSVHYNGRKAKKMIDEAKRNILGSLNASPIEYEIIFTCSGTESNNLVVQSSNFQNIIISSIEHPSVLEPAKKKNYVEIPVDNEGRINIDSLKKLVADAPENSLLSIIYANNETGVIQDFDIIFESIKHIGKKIIFHSDASQAYGKVKIDLADHPFDIVTISGHKFGGPQGSSAIIKRKNINITPLIYGGGQEYGIRPGTENICAISGLSAAASQIPKNIENYKIVKELRNDLEDQLQKLSPNIFFNSANANRTPNTCSFGVTGLANDVLLINLDLKGFAVSAGSACSSGKIETSHILRAFGYGDDKAASSIRVSLGLTNTKKEINHFISAIRDILVQQKIITESNNE